MSESKPLVKFEITAPQDAEGNGEIFVDPEKRISANRVLQTVKSIDFDAVSGAVAELVDRMSGAFVPKPGGPKETEIEFAISIEADGNLILASMGSAMSMKVKVKLDRE